MTVQQKELFLLYIYTAIFYNQFIILELMQSILMNVYIHKKLEIDSEANLEYIPIGSP